MLHILRQRVRRYREVVLAVVFVGLASQEIFEIWAFEVPVKSLLSLSVFVHSLQVVVILGATWLVLRAWQEKTAREEALARLVEKVVFAREEERRRIAYDIHDGLAQLIVSAKQHIDTAADLGAGGAGPAGQEIAKGLDRLDRAVVETRHVLLALRPSALDSLGLADATRGLLREAAHEGGWTVGFHENVSDARLPAAVEAAAFRIVQEALANVLRHARASRVDVELRRDGDWLGLEVRDGGVGFAAGSGRRGRGLGLESMRERARLLGGTCEVASGPRAGTHVSARLPLGNGHAGGCA